MVKIQEKGKTVYEDNVHVDTPATYNSKYEKTEMWIISQNAL
jgi:hypothetical protein